MKQLAGQTVLRHISIILCIALFLEFGCMVFAEEVSMGYDEILIRYEAHSMEYANLALSLQNQIIRYQEYESYEKMYNDQLSASLTGPSRINVVKSREESILNKNLLSFYVKYQDEVLVMEQNQLKYQFLMEYLKIPVLEKYAQAQETVYTQSKSEYQSMVQKRKHGYATKQNVRDAKIQMQEAKEKMEEAFDSYQQLLNVTKRETGVQKVGTFSLSEKLELQSESTYQEKYGNSPSLLLFDYQITAYQDYQDSVERLLPDEENLIWKAQNQITQLQNRKMISSKSVSENIQKQLMAFRHAKSKSQIYDAKISAAKAQREKKKQLYKRGKVTKLEILKQNAVIDGLEYEKQECLYDMNQAYFYLTYSITQ